MKTIHLSKIQGVGVMIAVGLLLLTPLLVIGATMQAGDEVTIAQGNDIEDNLYVAGGNVSINSVVTGDLYTAGGNILLTQTVTEDIVVAGGSITILGDTGDDVRAAGGNILIAGAVGGELIAAGGVVTVSPDVVVVGDAVIAGGQVALDGEVLGDVELLAGIATINGRIQGDVVAKVDEKLTIGDGAVINGNLAYSAGNADALKMGEGAIVTGEVVFEKIETIGKAEAENALAAFVGAFIFFKLATLIVVALILTWLFKNFSNATVRRVTQNPLRMLGYGFVTVVVAPVAAILLLVTLLGIPLGLMVLLSYGLLLIVSCVYMGVVVGAWLSQLMFKTHTPVVTWKNVIGGTVLLTIMTWVPVAGWIVGFGVFLVTVGAITDVVLQKLWKQR